MFKNINFNLKIDLVSFDTQSYCRALERKKKMKAANITERIGLLNMIYWLF